MYDDKDKFHYQMHCHFSVALVGLLSLLQGNFVIVCTSPLHRDWQRRLACTLDFNPNHQTAQVIDSHLNSLQ